jgi:RimJ/RimL family protein N-acetyltransferase
MNHPDFQPVLKGDLVELRPVRADDWEAMFAAAADPLIWEAHPVRDRHQAPVFREFFDGAVDSKMALTILDAKTGEIIGSSRYHGYEPALGEVEIGWTFIARRYWGGAYNRQIKRLMLAHAFGFADVVIFMVGETNVRSRRAMEKIGGVLRSEVRERAYGGRSYGHVVYEIRKPGPAELGLQPLPS